jgi:hypothetical protein
MQPNLSDIDRLARPLQSVEEDALSLRWAKERPWKRDTHLWFESGMLIIDLHDLNASLSKRVLSAVEELGESLEGGGAIFVTGRGRHSVGLPVLGQVVSGRLSRLERERGWRYRDVGGGRWLMVVDESRISGRYHEGMPIGISLFFVVFLAALATTLPLPVGIPLAGIAAWFLWVTVRASFRRFTRKE